MRLFLLFLLSSLPLCFGLSTTMAQQKMRVKIERADFLRHDDKIGKNTQSLNGNVMLSHVRTMLYCDSAYMFNDSNVVIAYGNIHVIQNDSIHLYGDRLTYLGDKGLAMVRDNVRANKGQTWLYTEFLDYDRNLDKAYFYNGGRVVNLQNTLTSKRGIYYPMTNDVFFKDSVVGYSPKYQLWTDTTSFNTRTEVVTILGPTTILSSDSTIINSELGWYDTRADVAKLEKNNTVIASQNRATLSGKTLLYNRREGHATAWGEMLLTDSVDKAQLLGDYGFYNTLTGEAMATINAEVRHVYSGDTLFMHADTMRIVPLEDSTKLVKAYHQVKLFRFDIQARCDSMVFDTRDSVLTLMQIPIMWSQANQMTAHTIKLYTRNRAVYKSELIDAAFVVSMEPDSVGFDQVKGKTIVGYIRNNELYLIDVSGNGQTIYYPKDGPNLIGVNRAESSNMSIHLANQKISSITMRETPTGVMNPPFLAGEENSKLAGFRWLDDYRPKCKSDIFLRLDIPDDLIEQKEVYEGYSFDVDE